LYDPLKGERMPSEPNAFETAILDAGYRGYINPEQGSIVVLNEDVPVKHIGSIGDHKVIQRKNERIIPKVTTRVEGGELVRKLQGNEMLELAHPAKRAKIAQAAPSFVMQYGELRVKQEEAKAADEAIAEFSPTFRFESMLFSVKDNAELQTEQEAIDALPEPKKDSKYAGKKVSVPVKIEDTGEVATLIMDVDQTANDYVARLKALEDLVACA